MGAGKSPEFMAEMRKKSAAKRAETKKIKDAEKLILSKEREKKLKLADEILNPQSAESAPEVENVPLVVPKKKSAPRRALDIDEEEPAPSKKSSYKEEYYKRKLALLDQQQAPTQPPPQNPAYLVAKKDIEQHVNREVMANLYKSYFPGSECPY